MKKFYYALIVALLFAFPAAANSIIVKGYVKFSNGSPAVNHAVWISTDSATTPFACWQTSMTYTNANGYYIDTLNCDSGNIVKVRIVVMNCNGTYLVETPMLNSGANVIERNFTLCTPACDANFVFNTSNLTASFQSTSVAPPGSTITGFNWSFGDGSTASQPGVSHTYSAAGTYTVVLVITTSAGCVDSVAKQVTVFNAAGTCHAVFIDSMLTPNKFIFLSGASTTASNDYISQRIWKFGDGTGMSGNAINPDHVYQQSGTYQVCLKIISNKGCVDSTCHSITVVVPPTSCVANFNYQKAASSTPYTVVFNSSASAGVSATDSIVSRYWTFGDGTQLGGNVVSPVHVYNAQGYYQVCLKITTVSGCQKTECKIVNLADSGCHANFSFNLTAAGMVYFTNTSNTLGTNAQYYWTFGNTAGSTAINPVIQLAPGTYNVCLRVFTSTCVDSVCKTITIPPPPATNCEAAFQFVGVAPAPGTTGYKFEFNSSNSHATNQPGDSIIHRTWFWGDGSSTTGNAVLATHVYVQPGNYTACLAIQSASGCIDTSCKVISVPLPNQLFCASKFTWEYLPATSAAGKLVKFNSHISAAAPGDSIISRLWQFGDGTSLSGNVVAPVHQYNQVGTYNVCLKITTASGCVRTECKMVVVPNVAIGCVPHFVWQRTAPKQVNFNSSMSWVPVGDSIIERKWNFGDASPVLGGNVVSPVHQYQNFGIYTVSLKIKTAQLCEKTFYNVVRVQDSVLNPSTADR
ncbi:MAG TPA: PKD domain-containing protein, partial [Chitinophagaceae bacterium]